MSTGHLESLPVVSQREHALRLAVAPLVAWFVAAALTLAFFAATAHGEGAFGAAAAARWLFWSPVALSPLIPMAVAVGLRRRRAEWTPLAFGAALAVVAVAGTAVLGLISNGAVGLAFQGYWAIFSGYALFVVALAAWAARAAK